MSRLVQHVARLLVGIVATPYIILSLGPVRYGAWLVLQQGVSYLGALDLQSFGALKYRLALSQHEQDFEKKRRYVGASLVLWLTMLLPFLLVAGIMVYAAPIVVRMAEVFHVDLRWAVAISALAIALGRLFSLPSNVLRGINRDYFAEIPATVAILIGGACSVAAVHYQLGLTGLACAGMIGPLLLGAVQFGVMRRACEWFGVAWPTPSELRGFTLLSGALLLSGLSLFFLLSTDMLVTAHVVSLEGAALLGTTGAALRFSIDPLHQVLSSTSSGIIGLCGRGEWQRVTSLRAELQSHSVLAIGWIGACVVLLNGSFLTLWVGHGFYGGSLLTVALLVLFLVTVLLKNDAVLVDALGYMRRKSVVTIISCFLSVALSISGGLWNALLGIVLGLCLGRLPLYFWQSYRLQEHMRRFGVRMPPSLLRPVLAVAVLIVLAASGSGSVRISSWWDFVACAAGAACVSALWLFLAGLRSQEREQVLARIRSVGGRVRAAKR